MRTMQTPHSDIYARTWLQLIKHEIFLSENDPILAFKRWRQCDARDVYRSFICRGPNIWHIETHGSVLTPTKEISMPVAARAVKGANKKINFRG